MVQCGAFFGRKFLVQVLERSWIQKNKTLTVTGLTTAGTYVYELKGVDNDVAFKSDRATVVVK